MLSSPSPGEGCSPPTEERIADQQPWATESLRRQESPALGQGLSSDGGQQGVPGGQGKGQTAARPLCCFPVFLRPLGDVLEG